MTQQAESSRWHRFASWCRRWWRHVLDLALILWVVRVPVFLVALGLLILGMAPQAQDLFVELARAMHERVPLFFFLLFFVWAMPTHGATSASRRFFQLHPHRRRQISEAVETVRTQYLMNVDRRRYLLHINGA
jgi:hypothetical protein